MWGHICLITATAPVIIGAAIDVPVFKRYSPSLSVDATYEPGAIK